MNTSSFIAARLRFKGKLAVAATAISFFVIIIAVAISGGFRTSIRAALSEINGDIVLSNTHRDYFAVDNPISDIDSLIAQLSSLDGIRSFRPAIYRSGIARNGELIQAAIFKGIPNDAKYHSSINSLQSSANPTTSLQANSIRIPSRLASKLNLSCGDSLQSYFVDARVQERSFVISEIYDALIDNSSPMIIYADSRDLQQLNGWTEKQFSALELIVDESLRTREQLYEMSLYAAKTSSMAAEAVSNSFSQLFDWLDLIDYNVVAILVLMIVVAAFNMISGLLILLFRSISTIGILKAMGMSDRAIAGVFIRVSARLAGIGMLIGNALALIFCFIQSSTHLLRLDPSQYFVSYVPISLNLPHILLADLISIVVIVLLMLIPTLFISKVDPARTVAHH